MKNKTMPIGVYKHKTHQGFQRGNKGFGTRESYIKRAIKISKVLKGRKYPERMGDNNSSRKPGVGEKISKAKKGVRFSEKHKRRLRENHRGMFGMSHTEETKEKIRQTKIGNKNSSWLGGISFEPYSTDWTETLRRSIRERDKYTCQLCSKQQGDKAFPVHHIDYNKKNCSPKNLITLCQRCHNKTNSDREYWEKYFNA